MCRGNIPSALINPIFLLAIGLSLMLFPRSSEAMNLVTYDLDSLAYMSQEIVEGTLGKTYAFSGFSVADISVTAVYKGSFAEGDTFKIIALDFFRKPIADIIGGDTEPLREGAKVVLFLAKAKPDILYKIPEDASIYVPVPSGMKVLLNDRVYGFSQWNNPGPYELETDVRFAGRTRALDEFRKQLPDIIDRMRELAGKLDAATTLKDASWLMSVLREREKLRNRKPGLDSYYDDKIEEVACSRLANLHNPEILEQSLPLDRRVIARRGFGTPAGREYILSVLGDPKQPIERKLRLARVIQSAGEIYQSRFEKIAIDDWQTIGEAGERNSDYITRIARLAMQNSKQEDLCLVLTQSVDCFACKITQLAEQGVKDSRYLDLMNALAELKEGYNKCESEHIRFEIEVTLAHGNRELYDKLGSPCGPVISIMTTVSPSENSPAKEKRFAFDYTYYALRTGAYTVSVVLQNQKTGENRIIPSGLSHLNEGGGGRETIVMPQDLSHGKYRAYYQFTKDERVVSKSHYCEFDL